MIKFKLDRRKNLALDRQMAQQLEQAIIDQALHSHDVLDDVKVVAVREGIDATIVETAYQRLVQLGWLEHVNDGYRVLSFDVPKIVFDQVFTMNAIIEMGGLKPSYQDLSTRVVACPSALADLVGDAHGEYLRYERLYFGDQTPLMYARIHIPLHHYPDLMHQERTQFAIWAYLREHYQVQVASTQLSFKATRLEDEMAQALESAKKSIGNYIESRVFSTKGQLVEYTQIYTRARSFNFKFDVRKPERT